MNITYHNPEGLSDWGQTDGWRLLTNEEIKQPLPGDAEFFANGWSGGLWRRSSREQPNPRIAYRTKKPLPVSPLIAQLDAEIKAKQELKDIALAVEVGAEWEVYLGRWENPVHSLKYYIDQGVKVRLKPKPVTRPWSKPEDVPGHGPCYLRRKDGQSDDGWTMIIAANIHGVVIATGYLHDLAAAALQRIPWESLKDVLHSTDRINWKPCEVTEEAK